MKPLNLLKHLQRPINTSNYILEVDGFRFFAIFTVCLLHLNNFFGRSINYDYYEEVRDINSWSWFVNRSGLGVEIFFAISGFVIALPFMKHYLTASNKPKLKSYFLRRITRLEIPFLLSCILFYISYIITSDKSFCSEIGHFLATITYTHEFIYGYWSPFNPVTWSLETEIQFYILAPWLIHFIFNKPLTGIWLTKLLCLAAIPLFLKYFYYTQLQEWHLHMSIIVFLPYFLVGFIVAYLYIRHEKFLRQKKWGWDILGLIGMYSLFFYAWAPNQIYFCIFSLLLFISIFKGKLLNYFFTRRIIYIIGGMCYTIYLLHYPSFHFIGKFTKIFVVSDHFIVNYLIQAVVIFPVSFLICSIFFILIEKPCMDKNWPQKLYAWLKRKKYSEL